MASKVKRTSDQIIKDIEGVANCVRILDMYIASGIDKRAIASKVEICDYNDKAIFVGDRGLGRDDVQEILDFAIAVAQRRRTTFVMELEGLTEELRGCKNDSQ